MKYHIYLKNITKKTVTYTVTAKRNSSFWSTPLALNVDESDVDEIKERIATNLEQIQPGIKVKFTEK